MLNQSQLREIFLDSKTLSEEAFNKAVQDAKKAKMHLEDFIINKMNFHEEVLYKMAAAQYNLPFIDLTNKKISKDDFVIIPEQMQQKHQIVIFNVDKKNKIIEIATAEPQDFETVEFLARKTGFRAKVYVSTPSSIESAISQYKVSFEEEFKKILQTKSLVNIEEISKEVPIVKIVDALLYHAIDQGASDLHLEPSEKEVIIRYRIDGILRDVLFLPMFLHEGIVARLKVLSNLKLDERRLPQDGRFKYVDKNHKYSIRVSIFPTFFGEKVVLRLLNEKGVSISIKSLGLQPIQYDIVMRNIKKPHGMILVTGPTGCGKTTTLYAILNYVNTTKVNISTIEDPIEYQIPRVNQSQINPKIGFTFAKGLRSLLRQDPNIIMVGEIRDTETAEIAIHSALTGHLVLSTMHTNDAATALPRLTEMGVPAFLVGSTANMVIAQRLVRTICPNCIQSYNLSEMEIDQLNKDIDLKVIFEKIENKKIPNIKTYLKSINFFKGAGCAKCNNEGYRGRIGIFEILENNYIIKDLINKNTSSIQIYLKAIETGMITMLEDGFLKAKKGITSIEEILRVAKE